MIGIIGAMKIEVDSLVSEMTDKSTKNISGIEFVCGRLCGREAVLAQSGIGKVAAAVCAQTMILAFGADIIINTGVAGSLSRELGICDVAVSSACVQHDMDTSPIGDPVGLISGINIINIPADSSLCALALECASSLDIHAMEGIIACGDCFVATAEKKKYIADTFGAIACDMESAAIAQVCYLSRVRYVVLRAISDNADGSAELDYPEFVKLAAASSKRLTLSLIDKL